MITFLELMDIKRRMLVAGDAARRIALTPERFVFYEQAEYQAVLECLAALPDDLRRLLAEHDLLRARCSDEWQDLFSKEDSNGNASDSPEPVGSVPAHAGECSGEGVRDDHAGPGGAVSDERPPRKRRAGRPRAKRASQKAGGSPAEVGHGDGTAEVDRGEGGA
jgi:hypothetical protein